MAVNDYINLVNIRQAMPDEAWGGTYDALFATLATAASRDIDSIAGWWPGAFSVTDDTTRHYDGSGNRRQWIDPLCAEPTAVSFSQTGNPVDVTYTALGIDQTNSEPDYFMQPYNALQTDRPFYTHIDFNILYGRWFTFFAFPKGILVTGKFGFSTTLPPEIVWATTIQAVRSFKRAQGAFADTGGIVDLGKLTYTKEVDPEVMRILQTRFIYPRL